MVGLQYKKANKYVMKLYVNQKIQKEKFDVKIKDNEQKLEY